MKLLRQSLRMQAMAQLLPALEGGDETLVGGQAVLEGVMMRTPHAFAISVRKPSGEVTTHAESLEKLSEKHRWMGWPLVRGVATLGQAMALGYRALRYSANVALEEATPQAEGKKLEISGWMMALNVLFSLGFFIFFYKFVPLAATTGLQRVSPVFEQPLVFNLVDGLIRILLFVVFIWGVSRWAEIHRVFQYHGAEHKTVFAFEAKEPLEVARAQKFSTWHPRCGTSFLMTVMLIAILFYALVPVETFWARFAVRIALLPLIAGVSFEIIRYAARHRKSLFSLMTLPGLWLQRITTQPPDDGMVECAITSLDRAMELEQQRGGEMVIA
ncbi:MAG TPA: DUF1385 domain-containing protein [Terriglobales bacterium]|nr:DUF1385 domain-containing protein [Terriglobales bacterium]